jgi:hypothetical protein
VPLSRDGFPNRGQEGQERKKSKKASQQHQDFDNDCLGQPQVNDHLEDYAPYADSIAAKP